MNKTEPGVKYIDSILRDVAKETGRDYKEVKEMWRLHVEYLVDKIDSTEVDIIELPGLGNLYFNLFTYNAFSKRSKSNKYKSQEKQRDRVKELIEEDMKTDRKTSYIYPQIKRSSVYSLYRSIKTFVDKTFPYHPSLSKMLKRIEEYSTKLFRKNE